MNNSDGLPEHRLSLGDVVLQRERESSQLPSPGGSAPGLGDARKDHNIKLTDYPKALGMGAASIVDLSGDVAGRAADYLENKGPVGRAYSTLFRAPEAVGKLAGSVSEGLENSLSDDAQAARALPMFETDDAGTIGSLSLGAGAKELDVVALKLSEAIGSLIPTAGVGGVAGRAVTNTMTKALLKKGYTPGQAEYIAGRALAEKAGRVAGAATATEIGTAAYMGGAGRSISEGLAELPVETRIMSESGRRIYQQVAQEEEWKNNSPLEQQNEVLRRQEQELTGAAMFDPKTIALGAAGTLIGDVGLMRMVAGAGKAAGIGAGKAGSAAQGFAMEGVTEGVQGGAQTYMTNQRLIDEAGSDVAPMKGVISGALEEGILGGAAGGAVGTYAGHKNNQARNQQTAADAAAQEQVDEYNAQNPDVSVIPTQEHQADDSQPTEITVEPRLPEADRPQVVPSDDPRVGKAFAFPPSSGDVYQIVENVNGETYRVVNVNSGETLNINAGNLTGQLNVDGLIAQYEQNSTETRDATPTESDRAGQSPAEFDERNEVPAYLRQDTELDGRDVRPTWDDNEAQQALGRGEIAPTAEDLIRQQQEQAQPSEQEQQDIDAAIQSAGADNDAIWQELSSLRVTKRGKPFASEKEAAMASREDEQPVKLPEGYAVAKRVDIDEAQEVAEQQSQLTEAEREQQPAKQTQVVGGSITETPVSELKLSNDVPQFKDGANKDGVVEALGGTFDRTGVAPIQVWQRNNGDMEVISGRHRLDLARRSGEKTIPAQVHKESDGFDQAAAATLDAELNIRDNQGKVKDYAQYFQATGIERAEADRRGYTARALGRRAYEIATSGSEETIAAHSAGQLTDEGAERVSQTAPGDARLQAVGIKSIQDGKSITHATNMMQAVKALSGGQQGDGMGDMFGFDDSGMREAEQMATLAAKKQREISELLRPQKAVANSGKLAAQEGITDKLSAGQRKARMDNLQQLKAAWDTWSTNPELVAELRNEIKGEEAPALSSYSEAELQQQSEQIKQAQQAEQEAQSRYDADQNVDGFSLTGSGSTADAAMAQGQTDIFADAPVNSEPVVEPARATNAVVDSEATNQTPQTSPASKLDSAATAISNEKMKAAENLKALLKSRKGSLNSGIDPEVMLAVAKVGALSVADGAVKFAQYVRDVFVTTRAVGIDDAEVKPFLKESYAAISANPEKYGVSDTDADNMQTPRELRKMDIDELIKQSEPPVRENNDQRTAVNTTADSQDGPNGATKVASNIPNEGRGPSGQRAGEASQESNLGPLGVINPLDGRSAVTDGERGNQPGADGQPRPGRTTAGSADGRTSANSGTGRLLAERKGKSATTGSANPQAVSESKAKLGSVSSTGNALNDIKARMPFLTDGQAEDVVFAEQRFSKPNGFGVLFTNGTGTGKTFTGLGVARRMMDQGKSNILVLAPKQTIADGWTKAGSKFFGMNIKPLKNTSDNGGSGPVVTTYANLANNPSLLSREWDLIIPDETHYLNSDQAGKDTKALQMVRMLARKPDTARGRVYAMNGDKVSEAKALRKQAEELRNDMNGAPAQSRQAMQAKIDRLTEQSAATWKELDAIVEKQKAIDEAIKDEDKPRGVFLSATPFAYEKNVRWANGFLFDWGDKDPSGYNSGGAYESFMMQHFGHSMRYNKLNEPDAKVDRGLMQRSFNSWLKKEGALSARMLESEHDYDRRFVLTENAIGTRVDEALKWLSDNSNEVPGMGAVSTAINKNFAYLPRMYLLEAIKAEEVISHAKEQQQLGRKVLIIHDFKKGGSDGNPLSVPRNVALDDAERAAYDIFKDKHAGLISALSQYPSALETLTEAFPDAMVYNGDVPARKRIEMQDKFNEDGEASVMIAQSDAMREGVSIHDSTGKHQRVSYNLGLPTRPTASIQLEGRTYRTGQKSDAMFRYLTIGTSWERTAFATTIAGRASTAENLAMGEQARGLKESFIQAYEQADTARPGFEGEGQGGKAQDRELANALTPWDMAKSFYYGSKKQGAGRSSRGREGNDFFSTPEPVGMKMSVWADLRGGESALEPSVGSAAIGRWFPENTRNRAIEPSAELASQAALRFSGEVINSDFESHNIINKYDAVVMNPPFGSGGKLAAEHVAKALGHLRNEGRVVALIPEGLAADKRFNELLYGENAVPDVYLVGEVRLPTVAFERAGTKVPTRIIILDKQTDAAKAESLQTTKHDLTGETTVEALFDRLESIDMPRRQVVDEDGPLPAVPTNANAGTAEPASQTQGVEGVVEHITAKGKVLKGIVRTDLNKDQAKEIDPYTFKKDGGFFIREKHLSKGDAPRFSKSVALNEGAGSAPLSLEQANEVVLGIVKGWRNRPPIRIVRTERGLPAAITKAIAEQNAEGQIGGVHYQGKVYVVLDKIHSAADLEVVLLHEAIGHYGIRQLFGKDAGREMNRMYLKLGGDKGIKKLAKRFNVSLDDYIDNTGTLTPERRNQMLVDELLAHIAQQNIEPTTLDRIVDAVKRWLREHGLGRIAQYGRSDLLRVLAGAKRSVIEGDPQRFSSSDDVRFIRRFDSLRGDSSDPTPGGGLRPKEQTSTDEFKEWFSGSKVVDAGGDPLVVFHGSGQKFNSFSADMLGTNTKAKSATGGHFFTSSRSLAENFKSEAQKNFTDYEAVRDKIESLSESGLHSLAEKVDLLDDLEFDGKDFFIEQVIDRLEQDALSAYDDRFHIERDLRKELGADLFDTGQVFDVYLSIKNPLEAYFNDEYADSAITKAIEEAKSKGHDGVILRGMYDAATLTDKGDGYIKSDVYVAFNANQIKSSTDNDGSFSSESDDIRFSRSPAPSTAEAAKSGLDKLNLGPKPDVIDKAKEQLKVLRELDRQTATSWLTRVGRKANTELLDALAPIKYIEDALGKSGADDSGYIASRLATGSSSTMLGAMLHGLPVWKDGVIQRKKGSTDKDALLGVLQPLGKDLHNWLGWMAGHRAEILMAQGRENLLTAEEIAGLKALGKGKEQQFNAAKQKWNQFNGAILDLAQESGLVSAEARASFESEWYIPFFRESDDGDAITPFSSKGTANQTAGINKLKGGTNKTNDLLENIFHTTSKMIDASMKNHAARKTVENLMDSGIIEVIENPNLMDMRAKDKGKEVFTIRHNGEDVYVRTLDSELFKAMTFLDRKPFEDPFTKVGMSAKRLLTATVTSSPEFMLRNFLRDMLSAWVISKDDYNPMDAFNGALKAYKMDGGAMDMMFAGSSFMGGYVNANDPQGMADTIRKGLRRKGMAPEQIANYEKSIIRNAAQAKGAVADAWAKYSRYGEAAENATREAVYAAAIEAGKSPAQAAFDAKDQMDFSMLGASRTLQWFTAVLPFFNARIQGLGKLSREFKDNPTGVAKRGGMIMAASIALLAANWDNEDYEALPDWDKDMNWHIWLGDEHFRIPKPFEVGVIFGTIPERAVRAMGNKDTGAEFGKAVARSISETFALNPIPQAVNPVLEVYNNYDGFKGRAIESQYEKTLMPEARYDERTSLVMREIGEATGMSPKKIEHLVRGYLGSMGTYAMMAADSLVTATKDEGESPASRIWEWPVVKAVYQGDGSSPAKSTQQISQLYEMLDKVTELHNTVNSYRKDGRAEDANKLVEEKGAILRARSSLTNAQKQLRQIRNQIDMIRRDKKLTGDQKRERIDRLVMRRNDLASRAVQQNKEWFE